MAKNKIDKAFYKLINNGVFGKLSENIRNWIILDFSKPCQYCKIIKQQSKITFNAFHISYTKHSSCTFKQNEVVIDKLMNVVSAILKLKRLHMFETCYDKIQPHFGQEN